MATLLHVDSSGKGSGSTTHPLTKYFADQWKSANGQGRIIYRDLMSSNLPFVNEELVTAFFMPPDALTAQQKSLLSLSDTLLKEIEEADTYIFGIPMYNFTVPAVFKAYLDLIVRSGKTFSYDGGVPKGLLKNKRLVVATASGGDYTAEPMRSLDFLRPYVPAIFGFLGVTDVSIVGMHGHDEGTISATTNAAKKEIDRLVQLPAAVS
jgi:FMN-dependent NADH-azoreductase